MMGLALLAVGVLFIRSKTFLDARRLLKASVIYLPLLLLLIHHRRRLLGVDPDEQLSSRGRSADTPATVSGLPSTMSVFRSPKAKFSVCSGRMAGARRRSFEFSAPWSRPAREACACSASTWSASRARSDAALAWFFNHRAWTAN